MGHRHRFLNRYYENETKSLGLHHRVNDPVPKASFSTRWVLKKALGTKDFASLASHKSHNFYT